MTSGSLEAACPKLGIGATSLDHDLGNVSTEPQSHYLLRQPDGAGDESNDQEF